MCIIGPDCVVDLNKLEEEICYLEQLLALMRFNFLNGKMDIKHIIHLIYMLYQTNNHYIYDDNIVILTYF